MGVRGTWSAAALDRSAENLEYKDRVGFFAPLGYDARDVRVGDQLTQTSPIACSGQAPPASFETSYYTRAGEPQDTEDLTSPRDYRFEAGRVLPSTAAVGVYDICWCSQVGAVGSLIYEWDWCWDAATYVLKIGQMVVPGPVAADGQTCAPAVG